MSEKYHYCFEHTKKLQISADYQTNLMAMGQNFPKAYFTRRYKHSACVQVFYLWEGQRPAMYGATCLMYSLHRTSVFPLGTACTLSS